MSLDKTMYMNLSINKCNTYYPLLIHNCKSPINCDIHKCVQIKQITKIRYLGIIFDNNLRWNLHVNHLVGKLRLISYKFVKLRDITNRGVTEYLFCLLSINFTIWTFSMGRY
jgi:hypothetical protein